METFKPLELMEKKYSINLEETVCKGDFKKLFDLGNGKLARIPYNHFNGQLCNDRNSQFKLYQAYKKQELARELGVNYPDTEGIFAILDTSTGKYYPGMVIKNLDGGKTLDRLEGEEQNKVMKEMDKEIRKAKESGVIMKDVHLNNFMWYKNKIYPLDPDDVEISMSFN